MEDSGGLKELKVVEQSLHLEVAGPVAWGWRGEGEHNIAGAATGLLMFATPCTK